MVVISITGFYGKAIAQSWNYGWPPFYNYSFYQQYNNFGFTPQWGKQPYTAVNPIYYPDYSYSQPFQPYPLTFGWNVSTALSGYPNSQFGSCPMTQEVKDKLGIKIYNGPGDIIYVGQEVLSDRPAPFPDPDVMRAAGYIDIGIYGPKWVMIEETIGKYGIFPPNHVYDDGISDTYITLEERLQRANQYYEENQENEE